MRTNDPNEVQAIVDAAPPAVLPLSPDDLRVMASAILEIADGDSEAIVIAAAGVSILVIHEDLVPDPLDNQAIWN